MTLTPVYVPDSGRTFSVWVNDINGPESKMEVHLVHSTLQERTVTRLDIYVNTAINRVYYYY